MAKQWDSGIHDQQVDKVQEAVTFNGTFDAAPDVFVTSYSGVTKGTGANNITTTGFDCYSEATGNTGWLARETGFDEGSSSSSSSSLSSSSSSSSLSSSSSSSSSSLSSSSSSSSLSSSSSSFSLSSSSLSSSSSTSCEQILIEDITIRSSSSSSSTSSSSSSLSSSSSSSSSSVSSSSSSSSLSSSSSSCVPGTVVWGHHTAVSEDYNEDFNLNWTTGNGWITSGAAGADTETLETSGSGCSVAKITISEPWCLGTIIAIIRIDKYLTGSGPIPVIHYKTSATKTGLTAASWVLYNGINFTSLGWIQIRLTHV